MKRLCQVRTTGFDLARPAHDLGGYRNLGDGKNDVRAPPVLRQRAAIRDDRLKATAIFPRDVHDNPALIQPSERLRAIWGSSE
jgi:hypothetical protein